MEIIMNDSWKTFHKRKWRLMKTLRFCLRMARLCLWLLYFGTGLGSVHFSFMSPWPLLAGLLFNATVWYVGIPKNTKTFHKLPKHSKVFACFLLKTSNSTITSICHCQSLIVYKQTRHLLLVSQLSIAKKRWWNRAWGWYTEQRFPWSLSIPLLSNKWDEIKHYDTSDTWL